MANSRAQFSRVEEGWRSEPGLGNGWGTYDDDEVDAFCPGLVVVVVLGGSALEPGQECDDLTCLAEAHFVCENTAQATLVQQVEPTDAKQLIVFEDDVGSKESGLGGNEVG